MAAAIRRAPRWASALAGAALTAAVLTPLLWGAGGASAQAPPAPPTQTTVHLVLFEDDTTGGETTVDVGKTGPSAGDMIVFQHGLFDTSTKARVGSSAGQLQVIRAYKNGDIAAIVNVTAYLKEGRVQNTGAVRFSRVESSTGDVLAATGGSGIYAYTGGSVRIRNGSMGGHPGTFVIADITKNA
jgi:allene oxide cyclase-like protein